MYGQEFLMFTVQGVCEKLFEFDRDGSQTQCAVTQPFCYYDVWVSPLYYLLNIMYIIDQSIHNC